MHLRKHSKPHDALAGRTATPGPVFERRPGAVDLDRTGARPCAPDEPPAWPSSARTIVTRSMLDLGLALAVATAIAIIAVFAFAAD